MEMKLYENALASLVEGLRCWKQGENGKSEQYNFAILHISRFFELALKYAVYCLHPLLVFKKPYSKDLSEANTISPEEAFYILKNSTFDSLGDIDFDDDEIKPFLRLKKVRNAIEHYVYDSPPEEIKEDIALFLETATILISDRADTCFQDNLEGDVWDIYSSLTGEE